MVWRKDLDPAIKEKLRQFFLTYAQGEGPEAERQRALLARISIGGFMPADDNHLLRVREMEATENLLQAQRGGDPKRIAEARRALETVKAEEAALQARTGQSQDAT
jgi:phosphonate transport system substrate-binding protein